MEDETAQNELSFPNPDEFPSFDEVPDDEAQSQIPEDSFNLESASDVHGGCC